MESLVEKNNQITIAIIGGGIAGCTTALELAKQGYKVIIYEQDDDILQGTSARTPGRLGLGYHYFHSETAEHYMKQTVEFMIKYSDCFIGNESKPYLQHGRYFIVKDSLVDPQDLMASYDDVERKFEKIDPSRSIFGTSHLHRTLHKSEFKDDVNPEKVAFAFETEERLLDWKKFSAKLKDELARNKNIKIKTKSRVDDLAMDESGQFIVKYKVDYLGTNDFGQPVVKQNSVSEKVDSVVNCSWQNIEKINATLGIGDAHFKKDDPEQAMVSRLKLLAQIEIPKGCEEKHSMFFCVGPHAMFSNLGDGVGRVTFAPVTNFAATPKVGMPAKFAKLMEDKNLIRDLRKQKDIPENADLTEQEEEDLVMEYLDKIIDRWLKYGLSEEEGEEYGQEIIDGAAEYMPWIKDAKLLKVIPGIVKSIGSVDIEDKNSSVHRRNYSGVEARQIGISENAAMKLFYCLGNAKEMVEIIGKEMLAKYELRKIIDFAELDKLEHSSPEAKINQKILGQFFINHLQRNFQSDDLGEGKTKKIAEDLKVGVTNKGLVLREITQLAPKIKERSSINE
ncbi:MAG: FAD-dependent oxidoreductase [Pseudomonadota bacterium]